MAKELNPDDIVDYFNYIKTQAEEERQKVDGSWGTNLELYMDKYSFPEKLNWQTQVRDPIIDNLVVRMTNFFVRILMTNDNSYFSTLHTDASVSRGINDLIKIVFRTNKFPMVFADAFKMALLTSPYYTKVCYKYYTERYPTYDPETGEYGVTDEIIGRVDISQKDPRNIWLDPKGNGYIIEKQNMDYSDFLVFAKANGYKNIEEVQLKVITGNGKKPVDPDDEVTTTNFDPRVTLYHVYTKAVTNNDGETLDEHVKFTIAENDIVVDYRDNLLPRGIFPYVQGFPMKVLVGRYGRGYIEKLRSVVLTYLEALNLVMDSFTLATLGAYEIVQPNLIGDTAKTAPSLVAGKMYQVSERNSIGRVFNNAIDPMALNVISFFDRLIQNRSFQNEFFQGQPTAKGRPTAHEINTKTEQSEGFFSDIANEVENNIIEPTLYLAVATEFVYMDDPKHTKLKDAVGTSDDLQKLVGTDFGRRMEILKNMEFEVKGISGKILKMANFQKIIQILNVAGNIPGALEGIDLRGVIEDIFDSLDKDPNDMFRFDQQQQSQPGLTATGPQPPTGQAGAGQGVSTPADVTAGVRQGG